MKIILWTDFVCCNFSIIIHWCNCSFTICFYSVHIRWTRKWCWWNTKKSIAITGSTSTKSIIYVRRVLKRNLLVSVSLVMYLSYWIRWINWSSLLDSIRSIGTTRWCIIWCIIRNGISVTATVLPLIPDSLLLIVQTLIEKV